MVAGVALLAWAISQTIPSYYRFINPTRSFVGGLVDKMQRAQRRLLAYMVLLILLWGFTWPILKVGLNYAPPLFLSMLYTSLLGTALAWVLWFHLVDMGEVSVIAPYTFFVPLLSVLIGVIWLHEQMNFTFIIGFIVIALGIYLVNRRTRLAEITE